MLSSYSLGSPSNSFVSKSHHQQQTGIFTPSASFHNNPTLNTPSSIADELALVAKMLAKLAASTDVEQYDSPPTLSSPRSSSMIIGGYQQQGPPPPSLGEHLINHSGRESPMSPLAATATEGTSRRQSTHIQVPSTLQQHQPSLFGGGPPSAAPFPLVSLSKRLTGIHNKVVSLQHACEQLRFATPNNNNNHRVGGGGLNTLESSLTMSQSLGLPRSASGQGNHNEGGMVPQPPRLPAVPPSTSRGGATVGDSNPKNGRPTPASSPRLQLTKPSSERVRQLPRATVPEGLVKDASKMKRIEKSKNNNNGTLTSTTAAGQEEPTAPVSGIFNPNFKELQKIMTATLYNVVESLVRTCQADKGYITTRQVSKATMSAADASAIFSKNAPNNNPASMGRSGGGGGGGGDAEMVSIVNVEATLRFPPSLHRNQVEGSLAAGVLATGIALHQRAVPYPPNDPAEARYKDSPSSHVPITSNVLMFPIRRPPTVGDTWGSSQGDIIAVLVVENKHGGTTPFTAVDENLCNMTTQLLGEIMTRMPESVLDLSANYYDPIGLHVVQPFVPFSKSISRRRASATNAANDVTFLTSIGAHQRGDPALGAMSRLAPHIPEQVIRRATVQPSSSKVRRDLAGGGGGGNSASTPPVIPSASGGDVSTYFSQLKEQRALLSKVGGSNTTTALVTSNGSTSRNNIATTTISAETPSKAAMHELEFSSSSAGGAIAGLGPAPTLREMDSFLSNLTDCWQRSVQSSVEQQLVKKQQEREAKLVREKLIAATKHIQKLEAEMRLHRLNAEDYRDEYRGLHEELESFLRTKSVGQTDF